MSAAPVPGRCPTCLLLRPRCLCAEVASVASRTPVVLVRHALEAGKVSGTGALAVRGLAGSRLVTFGGREPLDESALRPPGAVLLYPEGPARPRPQAAPAALVVLDGTWHQARRMRQRIAALRGMPVWSLPPAPAPPLRLRRARAAGELPTIESIAWALELLDEPGPADHLRRLHRLLADRCALTGVRARAASRDRVRAAR
ncbi:MAG TPA: DTW domain-containing protein [Kofleriaceae bacterium]|nr:DTW domain-containing protein [Kofleriaceae bacterium]